MYYLQLYSIQSVLSPTVINSKCIISNCIQYKLYPSLTVFTPTVSNTKCIFSNHIQFKLHRVQIITIQCIFISTGFMETVSGCHYSNKISPPLLWVRLLTILKIFNVFWSYVNFMEARTKFNGQFSLYLSLFSVMYIRKIIVVKWPYLGK